MATIVKITRQNGPRFKAIIKGRAGRIIKTKTFTLRRDATAWAKRIEGDREAVAALGVSGARITVTQLVREYEEQWSGKDKSAPARIRWWGKRLGPQMLTDVTQEDLRRALADYAGGKAQRGAGFDQEGKPQTATIDRKRSAATVNRLRAAGSALFKFARQEGYIVTNPFQGVAGKTEKNKRVRYLIDDERERLLTACRESEWDKLLLLVVLALMTGARLGELLKLRWSDIDLKRREATLRDTKNGDDRLVPLPQPAVDELKKHLEIGNGRVFQSPRFKGSTVSMRPFWNKALADAGVENFRFHDLRHDVASTLVMNGATLYEVAQVLGHRSIITTQRYAHLSTDHKRKLVDRILGGTK